MSSFIVIGGWPYWEILGEVNQGLNCTEFCTQECNMAIYARDVVPFTQARARLSELAEEVKAGAEKVITRNGASYVALIDAARLDYYHQLEEERMTLLLLEDARRGFEDIEAGRTEDASASIDRRLKQLRSKKR